MTYHLGAEPFSLDLSKTIGSKEIYSAIAKAASGTSELKKERNRIIREGIAGGPLKMVLLGK